MASGNDEAIRKIRELRGVTWEWLEEAPAEAKQQPGMGVIAQDVKKVFPQLVSTDEQGRKRVDYSGLIAPLIEASRSSTTGCTPLEARCQQADQQTGQERQPGANDLKMHRRVPSRGLLPRGFAWAFQADTAGRTAAAGGRSQALRS